MYVYTYKSRGVYYDIIQTPVLRALSSNQS